eukprot:3223139-Lingulodinium_polyedra.AAC.1
MLRNDVIESTVCRHGGLQTHARALHVHASVLACAKSARACDLRAVAATDGRFDRIVAQFLQNVAQRC